MDKKFKKGDRVINHTLGVGTVLEVERAETLVEFDHHTGGYNNDMQDELGNVCWMPEFSIEKEKEEHIQEKEAEMDKQVVISKGDNKVCLVEIEGRYYAQVNDLGPILGYSRPVDEFRKRAEAETIIHNTITRTTNSKRHRTFTTAWGILKVMEGMRDKDYELIEWVKDNIVKTLNELNQDKPVVVNKERYIQSLKEEIVKLKNKTLENKSKMQKEIKSLQNDILEKNDMIEEYSVWLNSTREALAQEKNQKSDWEHKAITRLVELTQLKQNGCPICKIKRRLTK